MPAPRDPLAMPRVIMPRVIMPIGRGGSFGRVDLGRYNNTIAQDALGPHSHSDAMEICFLVKGRQTYCVGGEDFHLRGGDVFLTFPDESHSTGGLPQEKSILYWLILQMPRPGQPFLGLAPAQGREQAKALRSLPLRHFRGSWDMQHLLDEITTLCHQAPAPLRPILMANRLGTFLLEVIACAHVAGKNPDANSLRPVLAYIEQNLTEPLPVPLLARRAALSVSRFKARFKAEIGVPPAEYILRARVAEARRQIALGQNSITDIAFSLGFSSSQYFATVFKRFTGLRPSDLYKVKSPKKNDTMVFGQTPC